MRDDSLDYLKDKSLLVLAPSYPNENESFSKGTFVKYQVDELKTYFKKIVVISPVLHSFKYLKKDELCNDYFYDNVFVYFPRCFYIPLSWSRKILIDNRLQVVEQCIEEHKLYFDLIHAHFTWPSGYIGVKLKVKYGKPVITTIHENGEWFDKEVKMDHPLINAAWSGADALIRVNRKDVPVLQRYNKGVYSIPNGFSPSFCPIETTIAREQLNLSADTKVVFTLGNLIKRKGLNYLIDSMDIIRQQRDDVLCFIGGAGQERRRLQGQIDRMHLSGNVRLLGTLPGDQLTLWMNACDIFVLPSLNEGNPTVMFETLGCGKPFVGTRVGGVPEIITSEDYGLLVNPADPEDLADKILAALDREWGREKILAYAERYAWENIAREIVRVYENVLKRGSASA